MAEQIAEDRTVVGGTPSEGYSAPQLIELDSVAKVTLGKYAEDSADKGRFFE